MVVSLVGTYYSLVGQVNAIELKVEKFDDYPSANEINMKNELIRQTVLSNKESLDAIENKLDVMDERLYEVIQNEIFIFIVNSNFFFWTNVH